MNTEAEHTNPEETPRRPGWIIASSLFIVLIIIAFVLYEASYKHAFHPPQTLVGNYVIFAGQQTNRICGGKDILGITSWVACDNIGPRRTNSISLAVGDLNNDGLMDVVFGNFSASENIEVHRCLGTREGRTSCQSIPGLNDIAWDVDLGDINADGHIDAIFALDATRLQVCLGDGTGALACRESEQDITNEISEVALGDLNGDPYLDAVLGSSNKNNLACLGDADGTMSCEYILGTSSDTDDIELAHLNTDEYLDAVFVNKGAPQVCFNNGHAAFECEAVTFQSTPATVVELADINKDGLLDAVFAAESVVFCMSAGGQPFYRTSCETIDTLEDFFHTDVALGDVNKDGHIDAVFSGQPNSLCLSIHEANFSCRQISPFNHLTRVVALWQNVP